MPAAAAVQLNGVWIDPKNEIRGELLGSALKAWEAEPQARRDVLAIVDFEKPSTAARLYIVDIRTGAVSAYLTAHGKGSDPNHSSYARSFSNDHGTLASSLGLYRAGKRYFGKWGLALKLQGLSASNSNAEARAIVLHSADYLRADYRARYGKPGRSFGCFVVEPRLIEEVVTKLEGGALIYAGA